MYPEAIKRDLAAAAAQRSSDQAQFAGASICTTDVKRAEIDGELFTLQQNIERLHGSIKSLTDRLHAVLGAGHLGETGGAPAPIRSSPLGQSLYTENERLFALANMVDELRVRIQL